MAGGQPVDPMRLLLTGLTSAWGCRRNAISGVSNLQALSRRVTSLKMSKLDIAELKRAYDAG